MAWFFAFSMFASRSASTVRCCSSNAYLSAYCCVKAAVICDAYRGSANMSVDVLAVVVAGGSREDDGSGRLEGDTARRFPANVEVAMCVFVP